MDASTARQKAKTLVDQMTVEEAASQLRYDAPAIPRLGIPAYNWWNEALHGVARAGTATVFPQAIAMAATFDAPFLRREADAIADEGRAKYAASTAHGDRDIYKGLTFWSPNINIFRDPRWGRGQETYGEDPYLTSRMGVAFIQGLQGDGEHLKAAACAKHFAAHSGPEAVRHEFDAQVSPKDLWETYLPAFEAAVIEAHVEAVMGAYNCTNGEPCCASKTLMADILRGQWGFDGHYVSDCWALADIHEHHHVTDSAVESAALAIHNGCDLNCGITYLHLLLAYRDGLVSEAEIRQSAERVLATRVKLGILLEGSEYDGIRPLDNDTDAHNALAREAARQAMVLLKNDGTLPLDADKLSTVAVIGPNATSIACLEGNYNGTSGRYVTYLQGVQNACSGKARVLYAQGCHLYSAKPDSLAAEDRRMAEAIQAAQDADAVILCLGLDATMEGEEGDAGNAFASGDKLDLELPEVQRRLLAAVIATGTPVVTVVSAGSALRVEDGNAVLYAWYPGQAGGDALADLLFGRVSPSGKLPLTLYRSIDQLPPFEEYAMTGRTYRYFTGEPLYPFGYGLSYARYAYSDARYADGLLTVTVCNKGDRDAAEIVEVYAQPESSPFAPPNPSLCAFARVMLAPGQSRSVCLPLGKDAFTVVDADGRRVSGGKRYTLYVGGSQPDPRSVELAGASPLAVSVEL